MGTTPLQPAGPTSPGRHSVRRWSRRVGLFVFLFTWTLTTHGKFSVSGDEPHYLMVAHSLTFDGDLDLSNNYGHDDALYFGHRGLEQGPHARTSVLGDVRSVHDIGVPIAIAPIYWLARMVAGFVPEATLARFRMDRGLFTYSMVSLTLIALAACAMSLLADALAGQVGWLAALLVALVGVSPPVLSHAFLVFPEIFALAVTILVIWMALRRDSPQDVWVIPAVALTLGLLPWTHRKYSAYVFGLAFVVLFMRWRRLRALPRGAVALAAGLFIVPHLAFHLWTWREWGSLGGPQMIEGVPFTASGLSRGLIGLWIDRAYGVLSYGPVYALIGAAWALTWRRTWPFLVPALMLYLPMASFVEWWAGFSPAARYLVPIMPLCVVPLALSLTRRVMRAGLVVLAVPQMVIDAAVWQHPRWLWPTSPGINPALHELGPLGRAYESALPNVREPFSTAGHIAVVVVALAVASAALYLAAQFSRPVPANRSSLETSA